MCRPSSRATPDVLFLDVVSLAARVRELTVSVDVLVNNAGLPGAERRTLSANGYEATWQTNLMAAVLVTWWRTPGGRHGSGARTAHGSSASAQG